MAPELKVFVFGFLGALAPEIVRHFGLARNGGAFRWSWYYAIASLLFASLGGVVALAAGGTTLRAAFYAGVSTPVLINKALERTQRAKKGTGKKGAVSEFAPPATRAQVFIDAL